ncbi:hypothetical protein DL768_009112 [Monosporascus sp. mg162]|nr:hypothetical protein DL768_009112 [Monosporascus sp. mg162]
MRIYNILECIEGVPVVQIVQNTGERLPWCPEAQKKLMRHCVQFRLSRYVGPRYCGTHRFQQILIDINCDFGSEDESGLFIAFVWPKIRNAFKYKPKVLQDIGAIFYDELGQEQYAEWANLCLEEDWDGNLKSFAPYPRPEDLDHDAYSDVPVYARYGAVDNADERSVAFRTPSELLLAASGAAANNSRAGHCTTQPTGRRPPQPLNRHPGRRQADSTPDFTPAQTRQRRPDAQGSAGSRPSPRARGGETYEHPAGFYDSYDYYLATHHTEASTSAVPKATTDLRKCNRSDLEEARREAIEELESCYEVLNIGK